MYVSLVPVHTIIITHLTEVITLRLIECVLFIAFHTVFEYRFRTAQRLDNFQVIQFFNGNISLHKLNLASLIIDLMIKAK